MRTPVSDQSERGATAITVAVAVLLLMAMVSLAVDAGMGLNTRRGTQNAADLAALAAAWQSCNPAGGASPTDVARATAADNGYTHDPSGYPQVNVSNSGSQWTVRITERNRTQFGRATDDAPDTLDVVSEATAECTDKGLLGGQAIFGQSSTCSGQDVSLNGSNITINGGVHTNDDLQVTGSSASISGDVTYRDSIVGIAGIKDLGSPKPYPPPLADPETGAILLTASQYAPGGTRAMAAGGDYYDWPYSIDRNDIADIGDGIPGSPNNNEIIGNTLYIREDGVYYADGDINVNIRIVLEDGAAANGVTFVATGQIDLGEVDNAAGYDPLLGSGGTFPVFLLAEGGQSYGCNSKDIKISGSDVAWEGLMFAPYGTAEVSASGISSLNGSVIAYNVNLQGANLTVTYEDDPAADPAFEVELID